MGSCCFRGHSNEDLLLEHFKHMKLRNLDYSQLTNLFKPVNNPLSLLTEEQRKKISLKNLNVLDNQVFTKISKENFMNIVNSHFINESDNKLHIATQNYFLENLYDSSKQDIYLVMVRLLPLIKTDMKKEEHFYELLSSYKHKMVYYKDFKDILKEVVKDCLHQSIEAIQKNFREEKEKGSSSENIEVVNNIQYSFSHENLESFAESVFEDFERNTFKETGIFSRENLLLNFSHLGNINKYKEDLFNFDRLFSLYLKAH